MKYDTVRVDLENYFRPLWAAKYPTVDFITENSVAVDLTKRTAPFLDSYFRFQGNSEQLNINGDDPLTRFSGHVVFQIFVKEFTGRKQLNESLDFVSNTLAYKQIGDLLFKHPVPMPSDTAVGWHKGVLFMPFQFDTLRQPT